MIKELLTKYLDTQKIQYETHVDLKKRTWIHRGGIAGIYIYRLQVQMNWRRLCLSFIRKTFHFC